MPNEDNIKAIDVWRVKIPLATPYHLSKIYGTLTHSDVVILRLTLCNGMQGWGEADPGGAFDGATVESVLAELQQRSAQMVGRSVRQWVTENQGEKYYGPANAAFDVACHDALGHLLNKPVYALLGDKRHEQIESLWPTSSGKAEEDLAIITDKLKLGFKTYMLKMGGRDVNDDIARVHQVIDEIPDGVRVMADANQGWSLDEALTFADQTRDLPLLLIEQPVAASDIDGMVKVCKASRCPISADESIVNPDQIGELLEREAADIFSIKISKNGGLSNSKRIAQYINTAGKQIMMNSMIELGITQAASLHLGVTLNNLVNFGHAYMSTLRMADDVTDFSSWISDGSARIGDAPGLGLNVSLEKIEKYRESHFYVH